MKDRGIRSLAYIAIAAQVAFVASWIVAGAVTPGYSHARSGVSALAAHGMPHPWIAMAGLVVLGVSSAALAPGIARVLPSRPATIAAVALLAVAGVAFVVAAFARLDCDLGSHACSARFRAGDLSWHTTLHVWMGPLIALALIGSAVAIGRALWPSPTAALAVGAAIDGVVVFLVAWLLYGSTDAPGGIVDRVQLMVAQAWFVILAAGVLYGTRGKRRFADPVPLRPRDFFGSAWAGEGQVQVWPYSVSRRFGPRFTFTRSTTWKSDDVGVVQDRATFGNGRVEERLRFAHIVSPSRIHVSSDDLPDGLDITIDEAGYRTAPYRGLVPVGPLRFILRCRDETQLDADGTLTYRVYARWCGLPVGRLDMRGRPVEQTPMPPAETGAEQPS